MQRENTLAQLTEMAWNQAAALLWPFRWRIWWRMCVIVLLAGQLSQCSLQLPDFSSTDAAPEQEQTVLVADPEEEQAFEELDYQDYQEAEKWLKSHYVIGLAIAVLTAFSLFYAFIISRFSFVFIDVLSTGNVRIRKPFAEHRQLSNSYFRWLLVYSLLLWASLILVLWIAFTEVGVIFQQDSQMYMGELMTHHKGFFVTLFAGISLFILGLALFNSIIMFWVDAYVLPIMYATGCSMGRAWRRCFFLLRQSIKEAFVYLLWRIILAVCVGFIAMFCMVLFSFACLLVVFLGVLMTKGLFLFLPWLGIVEMPLFIISGILFFFLFFFGNLMIVIFPKVWIRYFSLRYLESIRMNLVFFSDSPTREEKPPV